MIFNFAKKWQVILTLILIAVILLGAMVSGFIIFGQRNHILKLKLDIQASQPLLNKIEDYERESVRIEKKYQDLLTELSTAKSLLDFIDITKKVNEELQR